MLKIFNTLTQRLQPFVPIEQGKVCIYVCGLTVYDYAHLGHARMLVAFDNIVRYLRALRYQVTYVRNITDVDDKILKRAAENHEDFSDLTARFIHAMHEDEAALGIAPPDQEPRATEHIETMISMIETLISKDCAYAANNGDVYFAVSQFPAYGKLSRKKPNELLEGARVAVGELKRDPRDFTLWKAAAEGQVGWDSPWGYGRPGWHIECSAMSTTALGETFDIHGGGADLMFPHHENEIAQSQCATGKTFANCWMHNGPLRVDGDKMAKSLGNFLTVRQVLAQHHTETVRYLFAASHYRSPINYAADSLQQSAESLQGLYHALKGLDMSQAMQLVGSRYERDFNAAMDEDFNTPKALSVLFDLAGEINKQQRVIKAEAGKGKARVATKATTKPAQETAKAARTQAEQLGALLVRLGSILGILQRPAEEFLRWQPGDATVDPAEVERLIAARQQARASKDWQQADQVRAQLESLGVVLEDTPAGTTWRIE